jgi:hypothetical protein
MKDRVVWPHIVYGIGRIWAGMRQKMMDAKLS